MLAEALGRLIDSGEPKSPPLIVFEEGRKVEESRKILDVFAKDPKQDVYIIETKKYSPVPTLNDRAKKSDSLAIEIEDDQAAWDLLAEKLKELGITKIILGGQIFVVNKDDAGQYSQPRGHIEEPEIYKNKFGSPNQLGQYANVIGCVAAAYRNFYNRFGDIIEISNLAAPHNRMTVERFKQGK